MGWNRGLGRRKAGRLTWNPEEEPKKPTLEYTMKKNRMTEASNRKHGRTRYSALRGE